jgi:dihydrolipoamide dehydrogenase
MTDAHFDLVVIGGGPGGYVAAIRGAQLGMSVACIEMQPTLGGTCLNVGCIPSKALLAASEKYEEARLHLGPFGVKVSGVTLDLPTMMAHKEGVVGANVTGVDYLFKKNKITRYHGRGSLGAPGTAIVHGTDGVQRTLAARHILIATGSETTPLPGLAIDERRVVSSTGALSFAAPPGRLAVIGGGVIGLELGSVWQRLGSQVTVIEYLDRILPGMDGDISKQMQRSLTKQGMHFQLATKVTGAKDADGVRGADGSVILTLEPSAGGTVSQLEVDAVLVAIGRRPYTAGLGLAEAGVSLDAKGRIIVDAHFKTNVAGIWAIGDVIAGPMLAHKAEEEGVAAAEQMAGQAGHVNYEAIPSVVYTFPEAASVGRTEEQLKAEGITYKVGKFPFTANGRARAMAASDGFVKLLADARTDRLLGAHIVGPVAGEMIQELCLAIEFGASAEDVARASHAHPTLSEAIKEAAMAVDGRTLHL